MKGRGTHKQKILEPTVEGTMSPKPIVSMLRVRIEAEEESVDAAARSMWTQSYVMMGADEMMVK